MGYPETTYNINELQISPGPRPPPSPSELRQLYPVTPAFSPPCIALSRYNLRLKKRGPEYKGGPEYRVEPEADAQDAPQWCSHPSSVGNFEILTRHLVGESTNHSLLPG